MLGIIGDRCFPIFDGWSARREAAGVECVRTGQAVESERVGTARRPYRVGRGGGPRRPLGGVGLWTEPEQQLRPYPGTLGGDGAAI